MNRLKKSVKFVFFLLLASLIACSAAAPTVQPKIVIVGAGFAGQAAAVRLIENGFEDVVILEAENRTGGRVHSVRFSDGFVDLGAQWVEGEFGNVIYEMTQGHFDHGDLGYGGLSEFFQLSNGEQVDQEPYLKINPLFEVVSEGLFEEAATNNGSYGQLFIQTFHKTIETQKLDHIPEDIRKQMLASFEKKTNAWMGSPSWFDISVKLQAQAEETNGSHSITWKKSGFKTGFDFLTKKLPDPSKAVDVDSKILLNKEVTNVKWNPEASNEKVEVTCTDGSSYSADHVIFTASLGVLKARHETLFNPKLSGNKLKAIETMGFGNFGKFFLEYEKPFWDDRHIGFNFLWTDEDVKEVTGTDKEWLLSLNMIIIVDSFPNLLEGTVVGKNIAKFEQLSDEKLLEDVQWLMERFAGKKLPNPINMTRNRWLSSRNFLGAYSYPTVVAERENVTMDDLAETLYDDERKPKILFAGEATIKEFYGFTHGAASSGFRAAEELIVFLNKK